MRTNKKPAMVLSQNTEHWEKVYSGKAENECSWFQLYPKTSMDFLNLYDLPLTANIIDVGGGDSHFVDALLEKGYENIYVVDISARGMERAKLRLGERASKVHWIVSDVTEFQPPVLFDFWHDRAAFHFLTNEDKINKYVSIAKRGIKNGGYLIMGTFSEQGPKKCSGLEVRHYSDASLAVRFEKAFEKLRCIHVDHKTPSDNIQNFLFCSFRRK